MSQRRHMRYSDGYAWLVFVAALDVLMTYVVLRLGGYEANPIADRVIQAHGVPGMVIFKFALIVLAIVIAEEIGRRDERLGRRFVGYAIALSAVPVALAFTLLWP